MTDSLPQRVARAIGSSRAAGLVADAQDAAYGWMAPGPDNPIRTTALGHSLHPVLTDLPLGAWMSASLVDLVGGRGGRPAATRLVGIGLVAAMPTAYAGFADWTLLEGPDRRIGAVHALGNDVAIGLFVASFLARARGQHARGVRLAVLGNLATAGAGFLGGYLALSRGTADRSAESLRGAR
jgi:uncharacterized membrane protein